MSQLTLDVKSRESGKKATKAIRHSGLVPGVYYIPGEDSIAFSAEPRDLHPLVHTSETNVVSLSIDGDDTERDCIVKAIQFDPITDEVKHLDLLGLVKGHKITISVPIILLGQAVGVKEGGLVQHSIHKISLMCLPKNIPNDIKLDISELQIGDAIYVRDIELDNVEFNVSDSAAIVSVVLPRVSKDDQAAEDAEAEAAAEAAEAAKGAEGEEKAETTED